MTPKKVRIDPQGNKAQEAFVRAESKETYYFGGVGSGKTTGGIMRLARHIYEWNTGETIAVVTPTVTMLRNVILPEMKKWGLFNEDWYTSTENRIDYPNGTTVILESAANLQKVERLRGLNLAAAYLDEIGQHYAETYHVLGDRLRTGDYRNLWGTGTPKGKNWAYRECVEPLLEDDATESETVMGGTLLRNDYMTTIKGVSTRANQTTPEDYKASRERQHEGNSYEQEIMGQFVTFEGLVYKWFDDDNILPTDDLPEHFDHTIYGLDFGGSVPTAISCWRQTGDEWYAVDEFYQPRVTDDTIAEELHRMYERYGRGPVYADHEPRTIEKLNGEGLWVEKADKAVDEGIRHMNGLSDRLFVARSCTNLINEFNSYQYKDGGDSDDVLKENDHLMDSARYALFSDDSAGSSTVIVHDDW